MFGLGILPPGAADPGTPARSTASAAAAREASPTTSPTEAETTPPSAATTAPPRTATRPATPSPTETPLAKSAPSAARVPSSGVRIQAAADYATSRGYRVGVAVLDTKTGKLWGASEHASMFAAESVVKVFVATRLLLNGQMTGDTADTAYRMITRSDDGAMDALYGLAGSDQVLPWVAEHYGIPDLGSAPNKVGWWSNAKISAAGLVRFYAMVKADPKVWPWLSKAMHQAIEYGSDGTYQFFGLRQADPNAAIKQGWGQDDDDWSAASDFNSTGFVNSDRYAVAILLKGPPYEYNSGAPAMVSSVARMLMPGGVMRPD
ncbi:MAG: hypothetical protein ABI047_02690 [Jatrophihabitantaceae bacterium]